MHLQPPMTMMDFFGKSAGTWLSQREVHRRDLVADESGESNLIVQLVDRDDPIVKTICQEQGVDAALALGGARFLWQANLDEVSPNPDYGAVLVDLPDDETGLTGKLLRNRGYVEATPVVCRYWFGRDGILTIDTDYENNRGQERCWFITDDFRVRVSSVRMANGVQLTSYCSERRCIDDAQLQAMIQYNLSRSEH
jgi:CpeS-like protein